MDQDLYDEFGNYIGPDLDMREDDEEEDDQQSDNQDEQEENKENKWMKDLRNLQMQVQDNDEADEEAEEYYAKGHEVVLHEDKQYYPDASKLFGKDVETLVMDEDAQPITQPIIEPPKDKPFHLYDKVVPNTTFSWDYFSGMSQNPLLIRNVAICGHLHHGKSLLCDMFIQQTHLADYSLAKEHKLTDNRTDERERELSIKCQPFSLVVPDSRGKNYLLNMIDTPGHPNFSDEVTASLRVSDGMLLVVDVIEGVTFYTQRLIQEAIRAQMEIVVVLNKMDRLVIELKLPVNDAYYKIKHTLDEINFIIQTFALSQSKYSNKNQPGYNQQQISPVNNNVVFASTQFGCCFSLHSFALKYQQMLIYNMKRNNSEHEQQKKKMTDFDPKKFTKFLWGDIYYQEDTRKFVRSSAGGLPKSFVHFILEPFYKLVSHTISNEKNELMPTLKKLGIFLNKKDYLLDIKPLLKLVLSKQFGDVACLVDVISQHFNNAQSATQTKVENYYRNSNDNIEIKEQLKKCDPKGPLCINIVKLFTNESLGGFYAFGRIISGTIRTGERVKVMGEDFSIREKEGQVVKMINKLWIMQARYKVEVDKLSAGNWILIDGIDSTINKSATITQTNMEDMDIFKPLDFNTENVVKVACEPLNPSELPKMLDGLRKISKSYPLATTKVEQSGEHIIHGTGELYMDSIFHDLRKLYSEIEIKVSEPFVSFTETVVDSSSIRCDVNSANKQNQISMIAEPLDRGLDKVLDGLGANASLLNRSGQLTSILVEQFSWDELTASSIWAFGPNKLGDTNMLIDYTLEHEVNKENLYHVKDSLIQGFTWAAKEGPLCEQSIKNVKFKILYGQFSNTQMQRGGSQVIPAARRVCYSSFLLAQPRIMEPYYQAEVYCPQDVVEAVYTVLIRRRAHVTSEEPKPGSPLHTLKIEIPVIESFGFETDLRTHTIGQAMVLQIFNHWQVAPGDPLDKTIQLRPLEPSLVPQLAREFMIKTRRRKGLLEDVSIAKFFDSEQMTEKARSDPQLAPYF